MKRIIVVVVVLADLGLPVWVMALTQTGTQSVTLPDDFAVWGIPLSMIMALIVQALKSLGVIKPDTPIKKSLGYIMALVGAVLGGGWAFATGATAPAQLLILAFSGAFVGLGAVGLHSAHKNFNERKIVG